MGNCLKLHRGAASWADDGEWEEWDVEAKGGRKKKEAGVAAAEEAELERVEVKIRVTRRQLQELLEKAGEGKGRQVEAELMMSSGKVCCQPQARLPHWRPSLRSIPEADE